MPRADDDGWAWFDQPDDTPDDVALPRAAARCFALGDGDLLLRHLARTFIDRRIAPDAGDAALWHLEGQRSVVAHLRDLIRRGRAEGAAPTA